ncbi:delta-12 fatty acid desaturase [Athelia psychrophila]|uniref:Delta-12 fatty acid desaturase n=1 Tax=Athelia psychrophila TaxID=1759441 RepID=A0A166WAV8_9AGAM|nr:delta-12 fatty acid desaturase [Fibularhizoctonia sp. CBS 109695]
MSASTKVTTVEQATFVVPDLSVKDLLSVIPAHCFKRSALRSSSYILGDVIGIAGTYKAASWVAQLITPDVLPDPLLRTAASVSVWALYGFVTGLFGTGLWVIAHECGHQAFSESKAINNAVGWVLHSALGVPYHSWRISHAKHHASTGHCNQDQVFVPKTRSELKLPPLDPAKEDLMGRSVSEEVKSELREAIGDSPLGTMLGSLTYLVFGWPMYLIRNASGQRRYPKGTSHFAPASVIFGTHQYSQILLSDLGIALWLGGLVAWGYNRGFSEVLRLYLMPYLWVNHWLVMITFLQHTDPILPHYRAPEFTFPRGALSTLDRSLLGDLGPIGAWVGATLTHGISETHVLHHVSSKIPHYNAWEAAAALRARLAQAGIELQGAPGGWPEVYRCFRECKFIEDEGSVVFYKNSQGLAAVRPVFRDSKATDSGVEVEN